MRRSPALLLAFATLACTGRERAADTAAATPAADSTAVVATPRAVDSIQQVLTRAESLQVRPASLTLKVGERVPLTRFSVTGIGRDGARYADVPARFHLDEGDSTVQLDALGGLVARRAGRTRLHVAGTLPGASEVAARAEVAVVVRP